MYIQNCIFILWNWGHHSAFWVICGTEERTGHFYDNFAGTENDLNHVLSTFVDSEHDISNFCHSRYVGLSEVQSIFQNNPNEFLRWIYKVSMQSLTIYFPLLTTSHRKVYILEQFVCKRHGLPLIPTCHYCNFLDTNSFTREVNVLSMVGWWYT